MAGSVFISYSRQDREFVEKLAVRLHEAGLDAWYDIEVEVGEDFADVLEKQIERCDAFIVVLTPAAASAKWVRREIRFAQHIGKEPLRRLAGVSFPHRRSPGDARGCRGRHGRRSHCLCGRHNARLRRLLPCGCRRTRR